MIDFRLMMFFNLSFNVRYETRYSCTFIEAKIDIYQNYIRLLQFYGYFIAFNILVINNMISSNVYLNINFQTLKLILLENNEIVN